jgi:transmembrane 9 superfamily protein 2/4
MLFLVLPAGAFSALFRREAAPELYKSGDLVNVTFGSFRSPFRPIPIASGADDLFCASPNAPPAPASIGQALAGDLRYASPYAFRIGTAVSCSVACTKTYNKTQQARLISLIDAGYRASLYLDGLPIGTVYRKTNDSSELVAGFEIGFVQGGKHYLRSNLQFVVLLGSSDGGLFVAGFDLTGANSNSKNNCFASSPIEVAIEDAALIPFTFSVEFIEPNATDPVRAARFHSPEQGGYVFVASASCILLSVIVIVLVLYRAIWKDGQRGPSDYDEYEGYEWKLIHGDVFRPPRRAETIILLVGLGTQLTLSFVLLLAGGDLSSLGALLDSFLVVLLLSAPVGGLVAGRFFKTFGDGKWRGFLLKAGALPLFGIGALALVHAVAHRGPAAAVGFPLIRLIGYTLLNGVLTGVGVLVGLKLPSFSLAQNVNQLPRQIPPISYVQSTVFPYVFAAVFLYASPAASIHNLMIEAWSNERTIADPTGLLINLLALVVQTVLSGVVVTFWTLSNEDYRWWWTAFKSAAGAAVIFFCYALFFWGALWAPVGFLSTFVYFVVIALVAVLFGLSVGAVSFLGAFGFVQLIYNSLKME